MSHFSKEKSSLSLVEQKIRDVVYSYSISRLLSTPWSKRLFEIDDICEEANATGVLFDFSFPNRAGYRFTITKEEGDAALFVFQTREKTYRFYPSPERTLREILTEASELEEAMRVAEVSFAPAFDSDFEKAIAEAPIGARLSFNSGMEVSVVKKNGEGCELKAVYEGDLKHISVEHLRNTRTYAVHYGSKEELQKLYCQAYDTSVQTAKIRRRLGNEDGLSITGKLEDKVGKNQSKTIRVGPEQLVVSNLNNRYQWFDGKGKQIERETVQSLFGWAKNSLAILSNVDDSGFFQPIPQDSRELFSKLSEAAFCSDGYNFMEEAFRYSQRQSEPVYASLSGLQEVEDGFQFYTYAFQRKDGKDVILRISYEGESSCSIPKEIEEVSKDDFLQFYQEKFREHISYIKAIHLPMVDANLRFSDKLPQIEEALTKAVLQKEKELGKNPMGLQKEDIDSVSVATKNLTEEYLKNGFTDAKLTEYVED